MTSPNGSLDLLRMLLVDGTAFSVDRMYDGSGIAVGLGVTVAYRTGRRSGNGSASRVSTRLQVARPTLEGSRMAGGPSSRARTSGCMPTRLATCRGY